MNESKNLSIIILAAGKGTRMKSSLPKTLHKIAGREMVNLVIDTSKKLKPINITVVISDEMQEVAKRLQTEHPNINFAIQKERLGTAHAVNTALDYIDNNIGKSVLVLYGDTPLIKLQTLENMVGILQKNQSVAAILGFDCFEPNKYGRLVIKNGKFERIVEFKDANEEEKSITLCNSGVVAIDGAKAKNMLSKIDNNNASKEYYLTDVIKIAQDNDLNCEYIKTDEGEVMGVNSKIDLAKAEKANQEQLRLKFMEDGVTLIDPNTTYLSNCTKIGTDVIIHPNVVVGKNVQIESGVEIKSFSHIEEAKIKFEAVIGPFARIRPGTTIGEKAKVGNFVEIKKSDIKEGAKISHLSYIGDSAVGQNANIGAGTITCNYDGYKKAKTTIGENVFIGSNSSLIAPVTIEKDAVIGAGSVITKDVKAEDLSVSRPKQIFVRKGGKQYHDSRK